MPLNYTRKRSGRETLLYASYRYFFKVHTQTRPFLIVSAVRLDYLSDTRAVTASFPPPVPARHTAATLSSETMLLKSPLSERFTARVSEDPAASVYVGPIYLPTLPPVFTVLEMKTRRTFNKQTH